MKVKVSKNEIVKSNINIIEIRFGYIQDLLIYKEPDYYTSGNYGWNADIYKVNGVLICTGYRAFGNIEPDYSILKEYENKAREILQNIKINHNDKMNRVNSLLNEFIKEVLDNDSNKKQTL